VLSAELTFVRLALKILILERVGLQLCNYKKEVLDVLCKKNMFSMNNVSGNESITCFEIYMCNGVTCPVLDCEMQN
jgi:hypothetical protein